MTLLIHDAMALLGKDAKEAYEIGTLSDIEFADDTMLMGVNHIFLQEFTDAVEKVGREFGLELHWGKVQLVNVQGDQSILKPDGTVLPKSTSMIYLGALIHEQGLAVLELSRRIGMCASYFKSLSQLWKHISISRARKIEIFNSLVSSKLLYGLSTMWLGL